MLYTRASGSISVTSIRTLGSLELGEIRSRNCQLTVRRVVLYFLFVLSLRRSLILPRPFFTGTGYSSGWTARKQAPEFLVPNQRVPDDDESTRPPLLSPPSLALPSPPLANSDGSPLSPRQIWIGELDNVKNKSSPGSEAPSNVSRDSKVSLRLASIFADSATALFSCSFIGLAGTSLPSNSFFLLSHQNYRLLDLTSNLLLQLSPRRKAWNRSELPVCPRSG